MSAPLVERAPAKLNLCLYVGATRADGLHELCSIFVPLDLADELRLEESGGADEVVCPGVRGPNLAATALAAFRERFAWTGPGVRLTIGKRIPVSGGLGGGSADAAATLRLVSRWSGHDPSAGELHALAVGLGADVPSQLDPRPLLVTGAGERLEAIDPRPVDALLLTSPRGLSTRRVYARADSLRVGPTPLSGMADRLRDAWAAARSPLDLGELLRNDLEPAAAALEPGVGRGLELLCRAGAALALPSGSGPTVFGLFRGAAEAAAARERVASRWDGEVIVVRGPHETEPAVIEEFITNLGEGLGQWAYLMVAVLAMAETAAFLGFIAPGEFAVIFGGVLAGEGTLNVVLLIGIVWTSCVIGDSIGFSLGRRLGRSWALKHGARVRLTEERLSKVEDFFERHGGKTIVIGRWLGLVRPLMPFTAGTSGLSYRRFLPYDVVGAGMWAATFTLLGYFFWQSFTQITDIASRGALVFGFTVALAIGGYQAIKRLRKPEDRRRLAAWFERQGQRPLLRPVAALARPLWRFVLAPLGRLIAPPARFVIGRLTPGTLGIEFTTVAAILAVSVYVLVLQIDLIEQGSRITGDSWALDVAREIEHGALTALAQVVSFFGRLYVVAVAVGAAAIALVVRRRRWEAATLVAGLVVTEIALQVIKESVERARPESGLVSADGFSYPSGHAALAVSYLAIAVVFARVASLPYRLGLVLTGLGAAVAIGVSRVYLQVHYLSDVGGGWALGLAAYSGCAVVALLAIFLRDAFGERAESSATTGDVASRRAGG